MEVVACSGAKHISKDIAKKLKGNYSELDLKRFADGELNLRFTKNLKGKNVLLVQSFYGNPDEKIIETMFAGHTAKDLGAKRVELLALYFPYFRQDKRFMKGQCVSVQMLSKFFRGFKKVYVVDPHLHRIKKVKQVMKNGVRLTTIPLVDKYIKEHNMKDPVFIGPDAESFQWAKSAADILGADSSIFKKTRYGERNVKISLTGRVNLKGRNVVILDDIVGTGGTMLKTIEQIKKFKPKKIYAVCVHGIYSDEKVVNKMKKDAVILSTNTIPSKYAKIDISDIVEELK